MNDLLEFWNRYEQTDLISFNSHIGYKRGWTHFIYKVLQKCTHLAFLLCLQLEAEMFRPVGIVFEAYVCYL